MNNLGINTVNFPIERLSEFNMNRAEICLGRGSTYKERLAKTLEDIERCESMDITYSIHLPIYVESWYPYDYLSAYFLDSNIELRKLSIKLLEYNMQKLKGLNVDFFVLHFAGIYDEYQDEDEFNKLLKDTLDEVNSIAQRFNTRILIEYFGSNINFCDYKSWIREISSKSNIGILTDLGHLHFASKINMFDFDEALDELMENSDAFHLWTTKGNETYFDSDCYNQYHHIVTRMEQTKDRKWAFDTKQVLTKLINLKKPMIIEASKYYEGEEYYFEGIRECVELLAKLEGIKK